MPYSPFVSIQKVTAESGTIPASVLPAGDSIFQYNFETAAATSPGAPTGTIYVGFTLTVNNGGGGLIFSMTMEQTYTFYSLGAFGTFWTAAASPTLYLFTGTATQVSAPIGSVNGSGTGAGGGISDTLETGIIGAYIPIGSTVTLSAYSASEEYLYPIEGVQISTRAGVAPGASGFRNAQDGEILTVFPGASSINQYRFVGPQRTVQPVQALSVSAEGSVALMRSPDATTTYLIYQDNANISALTSTTDGVQYNPSVLIISSQTLLAATQDQNGRIYLLSQNNGVVQIMYQNAPDTWSAPTVCSVTYPSGVTTLSPGVLALGNAILTFIWQDATNNIWQISSSDDGVTWA